MKYVKIICIFFLLFFFSMDLNAQELTKPDYRTGILESNYDSLTASLQTETANLDSLKKILDIRAKKINDERNKPNPDKSFIIKLMSGSANLSNEIESRQNKINLLEKQIENLKQRLNGIYTAKIDSLEMLEKSGNYKGNKEDLRSTILYYTEKKVFVSPKIPLLSFRPEKILQVDLNKVKDPNERKLYEDYFKKALKEVDNRLASVNESIKESNSILSLQKKTNKFLEETEFDYTIPPRTDITQPAQTRTDALTLLGSSPVKAIGASYENNLIEYSMLLNQLNFQPLDSKLKWIVSLKGKHSIPSLNEYDKLLKEVKKRLLDYKLILTNKINSANE